MVASSYSSSAPIFNTTCGSSFFFSSSTDSTVRGGGGAPKHTKSQSLLYCVFGLGRCIGLTGAGCYNVLGLTPFQSVGRFHRGNNSSAYLVSVKRFPIAHVIVCLSYCLGHFYFKYNSVISHCYHIRKTAN